ncbi:50S ribosomal protein L25 [Paenibacillus shunpengii]|uniref:Large ribosomal subunit protein bL25 n=1 Tax=Paenibacillus shunpengii TaxID=2054424 RepID=A0ABW5SVF2_9BACL|nr:MULTISPECIES: 50S ribosomal protein L25 [unclassified Paenibacillus]OMC69163.1 50S ribosomal protein L25 [Paenibacillus sp. FSL H7-0326]SDX02842.1 LSU ribosomal protein L25P [Paenibacillus sp. PDC88]
MKSNGETVQLIAEQRTQKKGSGLRNLRQSGRVPAVVYGQQFDSIPIHVDAKEFSRVSHTGRSELFELKLDGKTVPVLIKDMQKQNDRLLHVDFIKIAKNKPIQVSISIDFQGTAVGSKAGGVFQTLLTELEVEGLPNDLPAVIEVDISKLEVGDKLAASEIGLPKGVSLVTPEDTLVASVGVLRAADTDTGEAAESSADEEVAASEEK